MSLTAAFKSFECGAIEVVLRGSEGLPPFVRCTGNWDRADAKAAATSRVPGGGAAWGLGQSLEGL